MGRYGAWGPTETKGHNGCRATTTSCRAAGICWLSSCSRLAIYYWALTCVMKQEDVDAAIERDAHQINFIAEYDASGAARLS